MQRFYGTLIENGTPVSGIWFTDGVNLTFNKRSVAFTAMFGMLSDALSLGKQVMTFPISGIKRIEYFKFRLNNKAIRLHTANGTIELVANKAERLYNLLSEKIGSA